MRHVAARSFAVLLACGFGVPAARASNPIPGVGIVIKQCKCPPAWKCCSAVTARMAAGFFGPGSAPVDSGVTLIGRCSHDCGGCETDCGGGPPDGRFDFAADSPSGPFEVSMAPMTLYSADPISIDVGGSVASLDVIVTLSGLGPLADDPISGTLAIPSGAALLPGAATTVQSSSLDLHATITFADHVTGVPVGGSVEQDLHLTLQEAALPIACIADGSLTGHLVPGGNGATVTPFTFASAGGELQVQMRSLEAGAPVPARSRSWGTLKTVYR